MGDSGSSSSEATPVVLFLGAGASKAQPLDLPTTKDFLQYLVELARALNPEAVKIHEQLTQGLHLEDIEQVLQVLDSFLAIKEMPGAGLLDEFPLNIRNHQVQVRAWWEAAKVFRDRIRSKLFEAYGRAKAPPGKVEGLYAPLFSLIIELFNPTDLPVFTTNYDFAIEEFLLTEQGSKFDFSDGFSKAAMGRKFFYFDESDFDRPPDRTPFLKSTSCTGRWTGDF